jgi:hypothetical protein
MTPATRPPAANEPDPVGPSFPVPDHPRSSRRGVDAAGAGCGPSSRREPRADSIRESWDDGISGLPVLRSAIALAGLSNRSVTYQFAQVVKENRLAALVGRATGGNRRGIDGVAFFFVTLPNSRIEVDLPLVGNFVGDGRPAGREIPFRRIPDAGIDPDVPVTPGVDDIAQGVDSELRAAMAVLKGGT